MISERWAPIAGYEGLYEISDHGRVRALTETHGGVKSRRAVPLLLSISTGSNGYMFIALYRDSRFKNRFMHDLVLEAFVGPRPQGFVAAHDDGTRANNYWRNLFWKTQSDNLADRLRHGTHIRGERHGGAKLTNEQVARIRASDDDLSDLAALHDMHPEYLRRIRSGKARIFG